MGLRDQSDDPSNITWTLPWCYISLALLLKTSVSVYLLVPILGGIKCHFTSVSINEILIPDCSTYQSSDIKMTTNTFPATHYNNNNKLGNMSLKANIIWYVMILPSSVYIYIYSQQQHQCKANGCECMVVILMEIGW